MVAAVLALRVEGLAEYGWTVPKLPVKPEARAIPSPIKDFYLTNAICRASPTMQRCSQEILHGGVYAARRSWMRGCAPQARAIAVRPLTPHPASNRRDRQRVVAGKGVSVRVDLGGCGSSKRKNQNQKQEKTK